MQAQKYKNLVESMEKKRKKLHSITVTGPKIAQPIFARFLFSVPTPSPCAPPLVQAGRWTRPAAC